MTCEPFSKMPDMRRSSFLRIRKNWLPSLPS